MNSPRPGHEGAHGGPEPGSGPAPYPRPDEFQAAVDALADPLNDPLPGSPRPVEPAESDGPAQPAEPGRGESDAGSPWFRPQQNAASRRAPAHGPRDGRHGAATPSVGGAPLVSGPPPPRPAAPRAGGRHSAEPAGPGGPAGPVDGDTATLRPVRDLGAPSASVNRQPLVHPVPAASEPLTVSGDERFADDEHRTVGLRRPDPAELGGRAARRRAAQARGRRGRGKEPAPAPKPAPTSRVEARRAARAASREGLAIVASRVTGEVFISVGVLMLLFVAYQLWWTNVLAGQEAGGRADQLQQKWGANEKVDPEREAGKFAPGEGFAIVHIPKIDISTPIAQGVSKKQVLDKGLVGHYDQAPLKTAMPWDEKGNFALAGHRNTHGEPFRYINRLVGGDEIVVETSDTYYTYRMTNRLAATAPSNTSVIDPVPPQSGFTGVGRYVTLTTCTPEFTSKYRLIVWGKMVDERPRSKGKPDALVE